MNTTNAAWRVVAELAASQHGAFHRDQAADHKVSTRRLARAARDGRLRRPLSDIYTFASHPPTWLQRLKVLELTGATISGRSAAGLHHLDGIAPGKLEITRTGSSRRRLPPHVVVHRTGVLDDDDLTDVDGIGCTSIPRTLVDLAQVLPVHQVEPALDSALRAGVTLAEIEATITRLWRPGPTGLGQLQRLLGDPARAGVVPDSLFERIVERLIVAYGLPTPVRQHDVEVGGRMRRLDLAWPHAKVGVEAHSKLVHFGHRADEDDNERDLDLAADGWEVLYLTWKQAHRPDRFLRALAAVLARRLPRAAS